MKDENLPSFYTVSTVGRSVGRSAAPNLHADDTADALHVGIGLQKHDRSRNMTIRPNLGLSWRDTAGLTQAISRHRRPTVVRPHSLTLNYNYRSRASSLLASFYVSEMCGLRTRQSADADPQDFLRRRIQFCDECSGVARNFYWGGGSSPFPSPLIPQFVPPIFFPSPFTSPSFPSPLPWLRSRTP